MNRYNLQLFNLNLHIFVTAETVSRLLGLIRWRGNLSLSIIACWVGYRVLIEWGDKGAQLNFAIWMYSSQSATETEGVDATWRDYWLRVEVSSEDRMASELWWRLQSNLGVVRFQNGDPEIFPFFLPLDTCCDLGRSQFLSSTDVPSASTLVGAHRGKVRELSLLGGFFCLS